MNWKTIKDNYAREQGYDNFEELVLNEKWEYRDIIKVIEDISILRAKQSLNNAEVSAEKAARKERSLSRVYLKMYEAINNEENIPK